MENSNDPRERRKYPRSLLDLPFEYRVSDLPHAHGGLVVDASEGGLLIHSVEDMPVGLKLNIVLLFTKGFELTNLRVSAEIVRKDFCSNNGSKGYQYGLRIIQIVEEDRWKLKELLSGC
ncbi:MAG TPA: PilZ domain-containing protein [Thermodesulfobacteriota bacterium]|nr:PilZ domain-containing protein [Thermodesulfobacteriota bacterium]